MAGTTIRVGTRGSALAIAQATLVESALRAAGALVERVVVETEGDRKAPDTVWGEGAFVAAIQRALLEDRVDVAVHSAKDVPTDTDPRLMIGAYLRRADPRDCLVTPLDRPISSLDELPHGARVGTDSPRRTGFLLASRPDLQVAPLNGNVDTRLRRLDGGDADALVLAVAGLVRLGRQDRINVTLDPRVVPPAPGQGAICVEIRVGDAALLEMVAAIDHRPTRTAVEAERALLAMSGGGCRSPIGALGRVEGRQLVLLAGYAEPDGSRASVQELRGSAVDSAPMVKAMVTRLQAAVGLRTDRGTAMAGGGGGPAVLPVGMARPRVLVTRPAGGSAVLVETLEARGIEAVEVPTLSIEPTDGAEREALARQVGAADWVVVTSANAVESLRAAVGPGGPRWAAVGPATAEALRAAGATNVWIPPMASGASLAEALPIEDGDRVLLARTPLADAAVRERLRARGAVVEEVAAYRTRLAPAASRESLREALDAPGGLQAICFLSASAVNGLLELAGDDQLERCLDLPALCIGSATAQACRDAGFREVLEADSKRADSVAALAARRLAPARGAMTA